MPNTRQHLRQLYRAARGFAATARLPDRTIARNHRAALRAELSGDWEAACALWFEQRASLIDTNAPHESADKSLAHCTLKGARDAESAKRWAAALQFWDYLRAVEPGSDAAAKGIERSARHLAAELGDRTEPLALKRPLQAAPQAWKADVLMCQGKPGAAVEQIDLLEAALGQNAVHQRQRARLALHSGKYSDAVVAANNAIQVIRQTGSSQTADCLHLKAEALCDQDLHEQARAMLFAELPSSDALTDRDFAALFLTARNRDDIEEIRAFLQPVFAAGHKSHSGVLKQYGIALRDLNLGKEAQAVVRERLLDVLEHKPFGHVQKAASDDWSVGAARALLDLKADLDAGGFPFFLVSGTLLGAIREGHILPGDKDLDVGIAADVDVEALRAHMRKTGRFRIRPLCVQTVVRAIHANGTSIDIFRHWPEDGHVVHQGQKAKWANTAFTTKPTEFLGTTFLVPSDPELYLTENYGDWKTPAVDFDAVVDTPNMSITDREHLIWYCYNGLHDYYLRGNGALFSKLWAKLKDTTSVDAEISSKISGQLAAMNGEKESRGR